MKQMKNVFTLTAIVAATFFSMQSFAQVTQTDIETAPRAKLGFKGGANFSNLYIDDVNDENMKVGFNAGIYAKIPVASWFSLQPELIYSSKGTKATYNNPILGSGEYRFNLGYIEVPVLGVFNIAKNLNVHAGVYGSYLVNANIKDVKDNGTINQIADLDEESFERFEFGLAGGVALDVQNVSIGARYNRGLKEIGKEGNLSRSLLGDSKNSTVSVYIAFGF